MTPVVAGNVESPALHEHPEGEENLGEVVHQQDLLQLKRLPVLHQPANKDSGDFSEQVTIKNHLSGWLLHCHNAKSR